MDQVNSTKSSTESEQSKPRDFLTNKANNDDFGFDSDDINSIPNTPENNCNEFDPDMIRTERTQTLVQTKELLEVKKALKAEGASVPDDLLVDTEQVEKICCIPVKEGVRWWNLMAIPLVPCVVMLLSTYVNAQTIFLLRDKDFFDVSEDSIGRVSSLLVLVGLPGGMIGTFSAGYIFDILGRRLTLFSVFLTGSACVLIIPYTSPNVYPQLLIVRVLITILLSAPASNPLLADYVHKDAIGKAAALVGLGFIVGEVISMGVLFRLTSDFSPYTAFMIVSATGALCSSIFLCLVKEPKLRASSDEEEEVTERDLDEAPVQQQSQIRDLSSGFEAPSNQPLLIREETNEADGPVDSSSSPAQTTTSAQAAADPDNDNILLSEEEFKKLTCCQKLKTVNSQLYRACKEKKLYPVLFMASLVSRLYYVMFSTFWVLYLTSYVGTALTDDDEVSTVYANLMLCSVAVALSLSPLVGMFVDRVSPTVSLPVAFIIRATAIVMFAFIENPKHPYAYCVGTFLVFGTTCEQICSDSILMRNAPREIRGVLYGTSAAAGYLGQTILCIVGGWMFDHVSPGSPFYFVGCLDVLFSISCVFLGLFGIIRNDIEDRKAISDNILAKKRKVEQELAAATQDSIPTDAAITARQVTQEVVTQQVAKEDGVEEEKESADPPSYSIQ